MLTRLSTRSRILFPSFLGAWLPRVARKYRIRLLMVTVPVPVSVSVSSEIQEGSVGAVSTKSTEELVGVARYEVPEAYFGNASSGIAETSSGTDSSGVAEALVRAAPSRVAETSIGTASSGVAESSIETASSKITETSIKTASSGVAEALIKAAPSDLIEDSARTEPSETTEALIMAAPYDLLEDSTHTAPCEITEALKAAPFDLIEDSTNTAPCEISEASIEPAPSELTEAAVGAAAVEALKKLSLANRKARNAAKAQRQLEKQAAEMIAPPGPLITPAGDMWPPPYYFVDGLRRVKPYHFTYNTWCKERWRGLTLIEIFASEFRDRPVEYYRTAMELGDIFVNMRRVGPDYVVRNGDKISHTMHRHEPPVTAEPIDVIHEDDDMIVINKPAGVPVHPAGRYNFNSVNAIMRTDRGFDFMPYPCNRLDRLTSGIMFVGKSPRAALDLGIQIRDRLVRKEYLARVMGMFPDGEVVCDQPILQISPKLGLNRVRANGKSARTVFKRLAYYPPRSSPRQSPEGDLKRVNSGYSVVRCLPVTGRTHQIRVHLQHLGHPIQNDPIYANRHVWGANLGHDDADAMQNTDEDIISRLSRMGKDEVAQTVAYYDEMVEDYEKKRAEKMTGRLCEVCATPLYSDPGSHELSLWLHSLRYEAADGSWSYTSPLPKWAMPPEGMSGPTTVGGLGELIDAVPKTAPEELTTPREEKEQ